MQWQQRTKWIVLSAGMVLTGLLATVRSQELPPTAAGPQLAAQQSSDAAAAGADWRVLANTGLLAAGVVLLAVPAGTCYAVVLSRTDTPGRRAAMAAMIFLLFLPLYVQVAGWEAAIGKLGWLTPLLQQLRAEISWDSEELAWPNPPLLSGMRAVIFLHSLAALPWVVLIVSAGLRLVRREDEEIALLDAGGLRVIARLVLPQIVPFILAAALLVAIAASSEMTVTNIYLVDPGNYTLAEQVYMTLQSEPLATAVVQSLPSIGGTALLVVVGWWGVTSLAALRGIVRADRQMPLAYRLGQWKWPLALLVWLPMAAAVGLPLLSLAYKTGTLVIWNDDVPVRAWSAFKAATMPWSALWSVRSDVWYTVAFAAAAATLDLAIAVGIAHFVRRPAWKQSLAISLAAIAWSLPGPIVGLVIISLMNHDVAGIGWFYQRTDMPTILAQSVRAVPIVMLVVLRSLADFPRSTVEAARLDGAGAWSIWWRIIAPQRRGALVAAWVAGFAVAAGDLAWSILVLRPGVDTLQRRLFGDIHAGADDRVAAICLAISLIYGGCVAAVLLLRRARR